MHTINFYHLHKTNTYFALGKLLEKALHQKKNILVSTESTEMTDEIDETLWSYESASFLPHCKLGDSHYDLNPIYITNETDNPIGAVYLFIINSSNHSVSEICNFQRTFVLFNNIDNDFLRIARKLWMEIGNCDIERKYWVEDNTGWILKNNN